MSRANTFDRVWRKSPHAFAPPALAIGGWFVAVAIATAAPTTGLWPYALPFVLLAGWALDAHRRLRAYLPRRRGPAARTEPSAASLLARRPFGAAALGLIAMGTYFLVVGTVFGEPWLGDDTATRGYGIALMGVTGGLMVWEIVFGGAARRSRAADQTRERAS